MVHLSYFHGYKHLLILNTFFFSIKNDNKRETASQVALRNYSKEVREQPAFIGFFAVKKKNQKVTAYHNRHLKLMILVLFNV